MDHPVLTPIRVNALILSLIKLRMIVAVVPWVRHPAGDNAVNRQKPSEGLFPKVMNKVSAQLGIDPPI